MTPEYLAAQPAYPVHFNASPILSDCAVCSEGYGRGVANTCHSCDRRKARLLVSAGIGFFVVIVLLSVLLAAVFLVTGFNAVDTVHTSVTPNISLASMVPNVRTISQTSVKRGTRRHISDNTIPPAFDFAWERQRCDGDDDIGDGRTESPPTIPGPDECENPNVPPPGDFVRCGPGAGLAHMPGRQPRHAPMPVNGHTHSSTKVGAGIGGELVNKRAGLEANSPGKSKCCDFGVNIKRWGSTLPLDEFKILLVVWQILTGFSRVTGVEFPESYSKFLSLIAVVNLDMGHTFSASCLLPSVNFYARLLATTLTPLVLAAGMVLTYQMAKRRADIGSAGVVTIRAAWSRHVTAGLLLSFLVRFGDHT